MARFSVQVCTSAVTMLFVMPFFTFAATPQHQAPPGPSLHPRFTDSGDALVDSDIPVHVPLSPAPTHLPPIATGPPGLFHVIALPEKFTANALNNQGEIVGTWAANPKRFFDPDALASQAAVWDKNRILIIPNSNKEPAGYGTAISDDSVVGGYAGATYTDPIYLQHDAFAWSLHPRASTKSTAVPSQFQYIGHLPGLSSATLTGINNHREAVGWCSRSGLGERIPEGQFQDNTGDALGGTMGFYWNGHRMYPFGDASAAYSINQRGQIVGLWRGQIALWQQNERRLLGDGRAYSINNRGWIVGEMDTGESSDTLGECPIRHTFLYHGKNGKSRVQDLHCLRGDTASKGRWINDRGQIVGASFRLVKDGDPVGRAFLWQSGKMFDLNTLLPPKSGWILREARSINNKGRIVGAGTFDGKERSFLLTPR